MHPDELLSTADVARLAGDVHVSTVSRWVSSGHLPVAFRAAGGGGAMYFERKTVEKFLSRSEAGGGVTFDQLSLDDAPMATYQVPGAEA